MNNSAPLLNKKKKAAEQRKKNNCSQLLYRTCTLRNFAKLTGKTINKNHLLQSYRPHPY